MHDCIALLLRKRKEMWEHILKRKVLEMSSCRNFCTFTVCTCLEQVMPPPDK